VRERVAKSARVTAMKILARDQRECLQATAGLGPVLTMDCDNRRQYLRWDCLTGSQKLVRASFVMVLVTKVTRRNRCLCSTQSNRVVQRPSKYDSEQIYRESIDYGVVEIAEKLWSSVRCKPEVV